MRVLLTSGGTRTPIDEVRYVGNFSNGTFGNHLCQAFLEAGHDVTFLYAKGSKCPHELRLDLLSFPRRHAFEEGANYFGMVDYLATMEARMTDGVRLLSLCDCKYHPMLYADFHGYAEQLRYILEQVKYDIVVLAAAVSDFAPKKTEGKIGSDYLELDIRLIQTPKLIQEVKAYQPNTFLVGFKLLVGSTQEQLEKAMAEQMHKADCDMVVGNDLRDIRAAKHKLTILSIDQHFYEYGPLPGKDLATDLMIDIVSDKNSLESTKAELAKKGKHE